MRRGFQLLVALMVLAKADFKEEKCDMEEVPVEEADAHSGEVVRIMSLPYVVSLNDKNEFFCGGTIIDNNTILTSADCVEKRNVRDISARVGSFTLYKYGRQYGVKKVVLHPRYNRTTKDYNVGILKTDRSIHFCRKIGAISLTDEEPRDGVTLGMSGWGEPNDGGNVSRNLRYVEVVKVDRKKCTEAYSKKLSISGRMMCSLGKERGACHKDNGGPVVHDDKLVGVISHRIDCASSKYPDISVNIGNRDIHTFIRSNMYE